MINTTPLVSVIMSVHNGDRWLEEAIQSVFRQTYTHWEFIIIDDASNEATKKILNNYKNDAKFKIKRIEPQNGLVKNLNIAIGMCSGELVARMDADDISLPDRFQKQVLFFQQFPQTDVVAGFIEFIDEDGNSNGAWKDDRECITNEQIKKRLPWRNCIAHPTVMIKKKIFDEFNYHENKNSEDWDLWLRLTDHGKVIDKVAETVLLYRVHSRSTTSLSNKGFALKKMNQSYKLYFRSIEKDRQKTPFNRKVRIAFLFNSVKLFLSRIKRLFTS